jgi:hypothetical protein
MTERKRKRGPEPERVKIDEDWEKAVERALTKKRPKDGWPTPDSDEKSHSGPKSN